LSEATDEITKLYDGTIELRYSDKAHRYWHRKAGDTKWLPTPSVTTILNVIAKPALVPWAAKMCAIYLREHHEELEAVGVDAFSEVMRKNFNVQKDSAADIGTAVHRYVEDFGRYKLGLTDHRPARPHRDIGSDEIANGVDAFHAFLEEHEVVWESCERRVFHRMGYAGTVDFVGSLDGKPTILDWKTGGFYPEARLQLSAYREAIEKEEGGEAYRCGKYSIAVVVLGKSDGAYQYHPIDDARAFTALVAALDLYRWQKESKR